MTLEAIVKLLSWHDLVDLILVYLLVYNFLRWTQKSPSFRLLRGLIVLAIIFVSSRVLNFSTLNLVMDGFAEVAIILLIIVFQPELRRILDRLGGSTRLGGSLLSSEIQNTVIIKQILRAVELLSQKKIGGLIAIEMGSNLSEYMESGIAVDSKISADLLVTFFWPNTPTHDGAVILSGERVAAAGCLLPLTNSKITDRRLGTRHRAALGLSEITDALIIVVSEETGTISTAEQGNLTRFLNKEALETRLFNLYKETNTQSKKPKGINRLTWREKDQPNGQ